MAKITQTENFIKRVFKSHYKISCHYKKMTKNVRWWGESQRTIPKMKHIDTVKREQQRKLERKTITTKNLKYSIFLKSFHFETSFFWPHCTAHRIPNEGLNPHLQQWQLKRRVLTTGLPGKSLGLNVLIPHVRIVYEICCYL